MVIFCLFLIGEDKFSIVRFIYLPFIRSFKTIAAEKSMSYWLLYMYTDWYWKKPDER